MPTRPRLVLRRCRYLLLLFADPYVKHVVPTHVVRDLQDVRSSSGIIVSTTARVVVTMGLNPKGRDWGSLVNWDSLGKAYAGLIISWTIILYMGVAWIIFNRRLPSVKIRNVPVAVTSVSFLHLYLIKIVLAYTTNGHFTCGAEFWIMRQDSCTTFEFLTDSM